MADYPIEALDFSPSVEAIDSAPIDRVFYAELAKLAPVLQAQSPTGGGVYPTATISFTVQVEPEPE